MEEQTNEALWYVVHTYSGYENKVANDLQTMVENRHLQDLICDIKVPTETVPEIKDGNTDLEKDKDFTYSYDTNTSPEHGGKVTINGKGNYKGMASKSFNIVNEITEITEDDLKDLEIPTLVTVKCTTTNSSKEYGKIPGGFTLGKPYMEGGVLKAVVSLNLPVYKDKYDTDTKKTHQNAGLEGNTHTAFTLKYVKNKWELDGNFPAVVLLVTVGCGIVCRGKL